MISWRCFVEGLLDENDGVNLGIHEIAHALKLANQIDTDGEKEFEPQAWKTYKTLVPEEIEKVKSGENALFRENAALNEHEFLLWHSRISSKDHGSFSVLGRSCLALVRLMKLDPRVWAKTEMN